MRVLQIIQRRQMRGAEIFACQLSEQLKKKGVDTDIIYLFDGDTSLPHYDLIFMSLRANVTRRFFDYSAFRRLSKIINKGKYNIVQANAGDTLKYAVFSKLLFRWQAKIIFRNANLMSGFMRGTFHRVFNRWLLGKCDYFISVSEICRKDLIKLSMRTQGNSITIPIGTYEFDNQSNSGLNIGREPIFINIGSFVPEKNHMFPYRCVLSVLFEE